MLTVHRWSYQFLLFPLSRFEVEAFLQTFTNLLVHERGLVPKLRLTKENNLQCFIDFENPTLDCKHQECHQLINVLNLNFLGRVDAQEELRDRNKVLA